MRIPLFRFTKCASAAPPFRDVLPWLIETGRFRSHRALIATTLAILSFISMGWGQSNGVYREVYIGLGSGNSLATLTNDTSFPDHPDPLSTSIITDGFEAPHNVLDHYGQRCRALVVAPMTGTYVFWVAANWSGAIFVSADESPFNKAQIAYQDSGVCPRCWYNLPSQQSTNIVLQAGRSYYIDALQVAGNGDDALAVGWKLPDGTLEHPIPTPRLWAFGLPATTRPILTAQPTNLSVLENSQASFHVGVSNLDVVSYQWQRNGTNLPAGLGATYTISLAGTNDSGSSFRCVVSNSFGALTSAVAVLTVTADTTRPTLYSAANLNSNTVQVMFSEPADQTSATNISNYSINNSVTITTAKFGASTREIDLSTSTLLFGSNYTLTVSNVRDRAAARNVITANSQQTFTALLKGIYREMFTDIPGSNLSDLTNSPAFPNYPSSAGLITDLFETPSSGLNNYGQRLRARIIPPVTGDYIFWIAADDAAILSLGTNDTVASARPIASVTPATLVSPRQWDVQPSQKSAVISLVAGQQYYIEALVKDGVSTYAPADHLAVRWQVQEGSFEEPISVARLTPFGLTVPLIIAGPANASVVEAATATFSVTASNPDPIAYQWQRNGGNIAGATNATYTVASAQMTDNGAVFRCMLSNVMGATNSALATLTVIPDTTRPTLLNVANSSSNRVVVYYSETVDPATATNASNYAIAGVAISSPVLAANGRSVTLTTTALTFGSNYTMTVNRVRDRAATFNVIATNSQFTFAVVEFFLQDIGTPPPGSIAYAGNGINLLAGNGNFGGTNDSFNYAYEQRSGDFDVKVRVARLDFADPWTTASLMARKDLGTNSPYAAVCSTPSIAGTFFQYRATTGSVAQVSGSFPVNYPYTWLRLQRVGGTLFNGYASFDGQTWTKLGSVTLGVSSGIYLGFAVSSHTAAQTTIAQFRDFGDSSDGTVGLLPVTTEPPGPSSRRTGLAFTEVMYHPAPRFDGRSLEYVELFNSNPFFEDISGYRISGDVDYTFPPGTILQGGAFLVVARNPADIQAIYGISNVTGPYAHSFSNKKGTVRLRNRADAILLEVNYDSKPPWPRSADGGGHSLVLARPSYGEGHAEAWGQSDAIGGSPGTVDGMRFEPVRNIMINEFLAHTDFPELDYIELYNHSTVPVNLSGCWMSDDPITNKFRIPDGTVIGPTGFVYFTENTLGFSLSAGGEAIYFVNSNLTEVVDSVAFDGQENGVATGRYPDGAPMFSRLAAKTPGAPNAPLRAKNIVINEIMHAPVTDDDNDQFVELYNRGTNAINLTGWRFTSGISITFPTNTVIATNGYLVIAKNAAHLMTNYPNLTTNNTLGNFGGSLGHSGDTLTLSMPDTIVTTNISGVVKTNTIYIAMDEVTYGKGGKWGKWNDGGGSSLELIDPHSDGRLPFNWADSDDTAKSTTNTISVTGTLDNADGSSSKNNSLQIYLLDVGECLVDSVSVSIAGSPNLVTNADFETVTGNYWTFQGAYMNSRIESPGLSGSRSLHVIADYRGDPQANRIFTILNQPYTTNVTGTISAKVKWLHGRPEILLRLRNNPLDLPALMTIPRNLGTPGARNSRYATNAGPAITEIIHSPVLPAVNQPVVVRARVADPDGVASVRLIYRVDPFGQSFTNLMVDDGTGSDAVAHDGIYTGTIPGISGQPDNELVAFYVQATDGFSPAASSRFPNDAPTHECLVHFGDSQPAGTYGTYRFWLTRASYNQWVANPKLSNEGNPGTFVYGNFRVIHNATDRFGGSPFHAPLLDTPDGTNCDYYVEVPPDDTFLNADSFTLQTPGNFGRDATGQNEQTAYWMAKEAGLPYLYRRSVNVFFNGIHRGFIYEDTQQPGGDYSSEFAPNSSDGELYKVQYDFEGDDDGLGHSTTPASLQIFTTTGGAKKLARYRETFTKRAVSGSSYNYTNLVDLVDAMNTPAAGDAYVAQVFPTVDIKEWMGVFALERMFDNTDLYGNQKQSGNPGGQNCYIYKPDGDSWKFWMWDVDFCFAGVPTDPLFNFTDPPISNLCAQPLVLRMYWQALEDQANGPWDPANAFPAIDARYNAYLASGISAGPPTAMKTFISVRRDHVRQLITDVKADFAITSNSGNSFTNATTLATLAGTAPISARTITINGIAYPFSWTSITNWSVRLALTSQTNQFVFQAYDAQGNALRNGSNSITIYFNGPISRPEDSLVITEIMYKPAVTNAGYVEIYNRSTNTTFGLFKYRLQGVDFDFSPGDFINPQSFMVVVKDTTAFQAAYGTIPQIVGEFNGNLDPNGESLTLIKQALTTNDSDMVIDRVKYEAVAPWSAKAAATNSGVALQLIDPVQDNARVSNWDDGSGWRFVRVSGVPATSSPRLYFYLDAAGDVYIDDVQVVHGLVPAVGSNYVRNGDFETLLVSPWTLTGTPGACTNSSAFARSGTNSLHLVFTKNGGTSTCLYQDPSGISSSSSSNYTVSFWYKPTANANVLTVRFGPSSFSTNLNVRPVTATPGTSNWVAGTVTPYPLLWINEVQPNNVNSFLDNTGTFQPWVELFNNGTNSLTLDGCYLAKSYTNLSQWAFPTGTVIRPGEFRVIFADGRTNSTSGTNLHTSFRLDPTNGSIVLSRGQQILDYINYTNMLPGVSRGSYPDGQLFDRQLFFFVTPGASNNPSPVPVAINEWMASNTSTLIDPSTGTYEDWLELYNFGAEAVILSGFYLTDDLSVKNKWRIPDGTTIAPYGFLLLWADGDITGTNTTGSALHTNFKISKNGSDLGLYSPDGIKVDKVSFGNQSANVSEGRYPDGNVAGALYFMPTPTPRTNNIITNNIYAPVLSGIPDYTINEGALLIFTNHATDADVPVQQLAFSLVGDVPDGASADAATGVFTWTPTEMQGPGTYNLTVAVTDSGGPPLSDSKTFTVTVNEVNSPPSIGAISNQAVDPGSLLNLSIPAGDTDLPPQTLSYFLPSAPAGTSVDATGLFTWTPTPAQASTTNLILVGVTDNGTPPLSTTQSFVVIVNAGNPCTGFKGDVAPRIGGNGSVTISDWVQIGRFAAGLADISNGCEFAKSDCAPKPCGNGSITISDWVQAGRYAAGLDPLVLVTDCPPDNGGFAPAGLAAPRGFNPAGLLRALVVTNMAVEHGQTNCLQILVDAQGDENGVTFSLGYNTNLLTYVSARLAGEAVNAILFIKNTNKISEGRVGLFIGLDTEQTFSAGLQPVVEVCFRAAGGTNPISTPVTLTNDPIAIEIVDSAANVLPALLRDGTVIITSGMTSAFEAITLVDGTQCKLKLIGALGLIWTVQGSSDLQHWETISTLTNTTGLLEYIDTGASDSNRRFYRAVRP